MAGLQAKASKAAPGETILDLFDRYAREMVVTKLKRQDTVNQDRKIIEGFAEFIGSSRALRSVSKSDVREWRDAIAVLPPTHKKRKDFAGLTIRQAAAKASELGCHVLTPTTVNKYVSTVSPLFAWAVKNGLAETNPCDGLHYDLRKRRNRRPPFTDEQIGQIFCSPLFTGFQKDGKEHRAGQQRAIDWRRWIPFIAAFTGARIGEIAQLRVEDISLEHGVWCFHFRDDEAKGQRTKSGIGRMVPMHSQLATMGLLEFVQRQRERANADGNHQLFPELVANERDQIGAVPSRFWRTYLKRIGIKGGRDGLGSHSFRHTVADKLRQAGYLDNQIAILLGHDQSSTTGGYGIMPQGTILMLRDMVESVKFRDVVVSRMK